MDTLLNQVRLLAFVVSDIFKLPGTAGGHTIVHFYDQGNTRAASAADTLKNVRWVAEILGEDKLGFNPHQIGTHSLCSGVAMAIFLDNTPVFLIILIGR